MDEILPKAAFTLSMNCKEAEQKMFWIHDAMSDLPVPLHAKRSISFQACSSTDRTQSCLPGLTSYLCNISHEKNVPAVKHGVAVRTPCVRCPTTMNAALNLQCDKLRTLTRMKFARNSVRSQMIQRASRRLSLISSKISWQR